MNQLTHKSTIQVRFNEVDSLGIVWHGHFVKYFEDGREAFGKKFGIGYMSVYREGFALPIVHLNCDYKNTIKYEDELEIETRFVNTPAAKIIFEYTIFNKTSKKVAATGRTEQIFMTRAGTLHMTVPPFHAEWKDKWELA